ncbi:MAG: hypothetical protein JW909_06165 [Planctomycetes bacterium]|nr:hypothetical protein [Planctomycetota bacterium]
MWYPMMLRESLRHYGFGARWIAERFDKDDLPADGVIAETWEACDHGEDVSVVRNGAMAGMTLHDLIGEHGAGMLGQGVMKRFGGRFPVIAKFLDATYELGTQVHPHDDIAAVSDVEKTGKSEAWYVIEAKEGATVHCGVRPGVSAEEFEAALASGDAYDSLICHEVKPGDMIYVPAGAVHASKGGILIFEIMQNCDITYVYPPDGPDGVPGAALLHRRRFMDAVKFESAPGYRTVPVVLEEDGCRRTWLIATEYFCLQRLEAAVPVRCSTGPDTFELYSCVSGSGTVEAGGVEAGFHSGSTFMLPAVAGVFRIVPDGRVELLRTTVPDIESGVIQPLRRAGVGDGRIGALCGNGGFNSIVPLL